MKKIVELKDRIEHNRQKESLRQLGGKIETIRKITQCSSCQLRCAMCGAQVQTDGLGKDSGQAYHGLRFCGSCGEEFDEYLAIIRGEKQPTVPWHNEEWRDMWSTWLGYRKAMAAFTDSSEFKLLMEELSRHS